jgi:hypothetical protein
MRRSISFISSHLLRKRVIYRYSLPTSVVTGTIIGYSTSFKILVSLDNKEVILRDKNSWEILE